MKLNWKFDTDTKSLSADGPRETLYRVIEDDMAPGYMCERRNSNKQMSYADWWQSKVPSLEEAMALCQRDAEEQKKRKIDAARGTETPTSTGLRYASVEDYALDQKEGTTKRAIPQFCPDGSINLDWEHAPVASGIFWLKDSYHIKFPKLADDPRSLAAPITQVDLEQYVAKALAETRGCDEARLSELEKRLNDIGTAAAKAASRVGQLWQKQTHEMWEANKRIGALEYKLPRVGEASLGTMHEEACKRLSDLEERAKWSADSRLVEERLSALGEGVKWCAKSDCVASRLKEMESRLTQALAAKMQHHEEKVFPRIRALEQAPLKDAQLEAKFVELEQRLIGGFDALVDQTVKWQDQNVAARRPVNQELGELRARVQELEAASCVYEGSLAFHDERLEKLEAK